MKIHPRGTDRLELPLLGCFPPPRVAKGAAGSTSPAVLIARCLRVECLGISWGDDSEPVSSAAEDVSGSPLVSGSGTWAGIFPSWSGYLSVRVRGRFADW